MAKVKRLFRFHKSTTDLSEWNKNDDKLLKAVERGDVDKVESLLNRKTLLPTKPGPKGMSVFQMAAGSGQLAIVERFLAYGVDINSTDLMGRTALHMAAKLGWPLMVEKLLMMGANQNCVDSDQMSAVHYACGSSHLPCVQLLIQYRANVNGRDKSGRSPLFYCAQSGEVNMCKLLLDHGAEINLKDHFGRTALIFAASKGYRDVCELLLKRGANAQCRDQEGLTAVEYSIKAGHTGLQEVFDKVPARASWGVTEASDAGTPEDMDNNSDMVNRFSAENSPTISAKHSSPLKSPKDTPSAPSSPNLPHSGEATPHSPSTTDQRTMDAYKELEEEHELLTEELRTLRVSHIRLQDKLQFLTERAQKSGENGADNQRMQALENELKKIKHLHSVEQEKNVQLETKLEKNRLQSESPSESPGGVDSWGDSDDELFGNPTEKKSGKGTEDQQVALLRSQILTLRQENDNLKAKLQQYENGVTNGMPSLSQSPLTHSISGFSEGESGILMNGERSRTPSDEGDVQPRDESNVQEENQILKETIKKMQVTYAALVEAGDKLQMEYDQLYDEKVALEEKLQEVTKEKEELTKENNMAAENLHEDIEKLFSELETLQQKNKQLEKEKEELSRHPLSLSINPGLEASGELARVTEERDALKLRCDELDETATRLKHDHDIVIEEIQSVQERFSDMQTDRDQLQQELDLTQDELEKLTQQYEQEYNQLEQDYAELLAEKGKLEQHIPNLESGEAVESKQTFSAHEQEVLIKQNSILSEEKEVLESKVLKLETAKQMLETELENVRDKVNSFQVKVSDDNQNILTTSPNSTSPMPSSSDKDKQIRSLQVKISRLQQQVTEMERKHKDTVNTYRTHLISAVQGRMHPEIREALHHIIDLRSKEEYC